MEAPTEEDGFWSFGLTDYPVASFGVSTSDDVPTNTSGLFGAFGGVTGEETGSAAFMSKEGSVRGLGLGDCIIGGLASMARTLAMVAMVHYL